MSRAPCVRCGAMLHTGEGRIVVAFSLDEIEEMALASSDAKVRRRLVCAIGLLDEEREERVSAAIAEVHG